MKNNDLYYEMNWDFHNRQLKFERQLEQAIQRERKIALDILKEKMDSPNKVVRREFEDAYYEIKLAYENGKTD